MLGLERGGGSTLIDRGGRRGALIQYIYIHTCVVRKGLYLANVDNKFIVRSSRLA